MLQLLIRVKSVGVNPVDTYIRSGNHPLTPPLPYTPGNDGAGIVEAVGNEVTKFKVCVLIVTLYSICYCIY